jgi:hypothetical protein
MTSTSAKLAGFAAALAALFGVGAAAGSVFEPSAPGGDVKVEAGHGGEMDGGMKAMAVRGLGVAETGLRIVVADPELRRDRAQQLRFRIVGEDGRAVRDFDIEHTKRMHLIVARRDLTGFQHLHPAMAADGTWTAPLRLRDAGSYRVFADFSHDGSKTTLADDLRVDGAADLRPLPSPATTAVSDGGYDVRLDAGASRAGVESELRFTISKNGRPVKTEPYLGAGGHLVALREGDLAFLHVHPTEDDDAVGFEATFPTTGAYRLFLQFKIDGVVQTVAFTQEVR